MTPHAVAYGYMRVQRDMEDEEVQLIEHRMHEYAAAQGIELRETHYEYEDGLTDVAALLSFMRRNKAEYVIVPSLEQITDHVVIQAAVASAIKDDGGAVLHQASEERRNL